MAHAIRTNRADNLRRAAAVRAKLIGYFNSTQQWSSMKDIKLGLQGFLEEEHITHDQLGYYLRQMEGNKLITNKRDGKKTLWCRASSTAIDPEKAANNVHVLRPASPTPAPTVATKTPQVKLTIVKATGNVRLALGGIVLEIGVE